MAKIQKYTTRNTYCTYLQKQDPDTLNKDVYSCKDITGGRNLNPISTSAVVCVYVRGVPCVGGDGSVRLAATDTSLAVAPLPQLNT